MTIYKLLVLIHVISAIAGLGPGFIMTYIITKSTTMDELRHGYKLRGQLHVIVMIGGILLLVTGLTMGMMNPHLFSAGWYVTSLILYMIGLAFGPFLLAPLTRKIRPLIAAYEGTDIPESYWQYARKLYLYENIINTIFIVIIVMMVLKPF